MNDSDANASNAGISHDMTDVISPDHINNTHSGF